MSLTNEPQGNKSPVDNKLLQPIEPVSTYGTVVENGTIEELGYVAVYRRVFRSLGNMCMAVALTTYVLLCTCGSRTVLIASLSVVHWARSWSPHSIKSHMVATGGFPGEKRLVQLGANQGNADILGVGLSPMSY